MFERDAIAEFINELHVQRGAEVRLISHPEDDPADPLTVDAVVVHDGELWAVDHVRLAHEPTVVPAGDEALGRFWRPLEQIADQHGCCLHVGVLPPRRRATSRREIEAYYANIIAHAEVAAASGQHWFDPDGFTSLQVFMRGERPDAPTVGLATWHAATGSVEEQVAAALEQPLAKKLRGQLATAKAAGCKVMLLIDQVPDTSRPQPVVYLASGPTVKIVVDRILASHPGIIDCVWFRAGDGSFTNLTFEPAR